MNPIHRLTVCLLLAAAPPSLAAAKENDRPDKAMLRMMDFLRDMEVIKQMEMMQDLSQLEQQRDEVRRDPGQKSSPAKRKGTK